MHWKRAARGVICRAKREMFAAASYKEGCTGLSMLRRIIASQLCQIRLEGSLSVEAILYYLAALSEIVYDPSCPAEKPPQLSIQHSAGGHAILL